ncbi:MAG: hypothetical protein K0V04_04145 [Deltaproteobacteria bacterium]|nr:hypothetical protein [Deltaproteobacteria bacterium]
MGAEQTLGTSSPAETKPDQFGGPFGALVLTVVMPLASFYLWAAVDQHGGSLWLPRSLGDLAAMFPLPTVTAAALLAGWLALQGALYVFGPGPVVLGRPAHNGERAEYRINGLFSFAVSTIGLLAALYFDVVSASWLLSQWGPLLMVCSLFAVGVAALSYVAGRRRGWAERSTGNVVYDYFMGAILNPRIGRHDLKFFFESRVGMGIWAAFAVVVPAAQLEAHGQLSSAMLVVSLCQIIYIVDFFIFESNLLSMLDIIEENFGFMLWFGFLVWMPFNFTLQQQYILEADPQLSTLGGIAVLLLNVGGYYMFRSTNLQKLRFRRDPSQPIWGKVPESIDTKRGTKLLVSGWWGLARKMNYLGDILMACAWCLACGFGSVVPYFYVLYFVPLLLDRERRDYAMCSQKYGDDWERYCKRVPYRIVPYVY